MPAAITDLLPPSLNATQIGDVGLNCTAITNTDPLVPETCDGSSVCCGGNLVSRMHNSLSAITKSQFPERSHWVQLRSRYATLSNSSIATSQQYTPAAAAQQHSPSPRQYTPFAAVDQSTARSARSPPHKPASWPAWPPAVDYNSVFCVMMIGLIGTILSLGTYYCADIVRIIYK